MTTQWTPRDPAFAVRVAEIFAQAAFVQHVGVELVACGPGWCEARLEIRPEHLQQSGVVHAGCLATLNDHTCGGAMQTLLGPDEGLVSVEFKNNMLRAAHGQALECRAEVLKSGRSISVVEARTYAVDGARRALVSSMTCTLMTIASGR